MRNLVKQQRCEKPEGDPRKGSWI